MSDQDLVYASGLPFEDIPPTAAALYCSDGRFGDQCEDFLRGGLGLPRFDRLVVPGGAACLAGHFAAYREEEAVASQLEFLISVRSMRRVILIAHENCAFYAVRLEVSPIDLVERQHEDLAKAATRLRELHRELIVEAYFAWGSDGQVTFERVEA